MITALRFLVHIDNGFVSLLEIGHGCLPAGVGGEGRGEVVVGLRIKGTQAFCRIDDSTIGAEDTICWKDTVLAKLDCFVKTEKPPATILGS